MTAIPGADIQVLGPEQRLISFLDEVGPTPPTAVALMRWLGIDFEQARNDIWAPIFPPSAFVTFINLTMRANALLLAVGFVLKRSGGRPCDRYWIEPAHAGSPVEGEPLRGG